MASCSLRSSTKGRPLRGRTLATREVGEVTPEVLRAAVRRGMPIVLFLRGLKARGYPVVTVNELLHSTG